MSKLYSKPNYCRYYYTNTPEENPVGKDSATILLWFYRNVNTNLLLFSNWCGNTNIRILFCVELMVTNTHRNSHIHINLYGSNYMIPHTKSSASTGLLRTPVSFPIYFCNIDDKWTGTIELFTFSSTLAVALFLLVTASYKIKDSSLKFTMISFSY